MLTQQQAYLICEAHEIFSLLNNDEEMELLEMCNPEMLEAYCALHRVAAGVDTASKGSDEESEQPVGKLEEGFKERPEYPLSDLDPQTLESFCEQFTREVFRKAGRERPPRKRTPNA